MKRLTVAALALFVVSCGSTPAPTPTISTVTISSPNTQVFIGATEQFTANSTLSNGTTQTPTGTWNSDNASVATISQAGLMTGVGSGQATIFFNATNGPTGTKLMRGLPNYGGTWSGTYLVTGCNQSGGVGLANVCGSIAGTLPFTFILAQGTDGVTGRFLLGTIPFENVSGVVSGNGGLTLVGRNLSNGVQVDVTWQLTSPVARTLVGSIAQVWTSTTLTGQANVSGAISTATKTFIAVGTSAPRIHTLQDLISGMLR